MRITVKSLQGDTYIVNVENDQLVSNLKAHISDQAQGLAVDRLKLVYKGRTLQDSSPLGDYNLEEGCKVHLILQKETPSNQKDPHTTPSSELLVQRAPADRCIDGANSSGSNTDTNMTNYSPISNISQKILTSGSLDNSNKPDAQIKFEQMLKRRLDEHFAANAVEKIMANLKKEINADINSSSLDDLERLAKQKLNISNE